jgi:hypothetical protein
MFLILLCFFFYHVSACVAVEGNSFSFTVYNLRNKNFIGPQQGTYTISSLVNSYIFPEIGT